MSEPPATPTQIAYIKNLLNNIEREGPEVFLDQFCHWANLYIETLDAEDEETINERAHRAAPVIVTLMRMTGNLDFDQVREAMVDVVAKALLQAKLDGRNKITMADLEALMNGLVEELQP